MSDLKKYVFRGEQSIRHSTRISHLPQTSKTRSSEQSREDELPSRPSTAYHGDELHSRPPQLTQTRCTKQEQESGSPIKNGNFQIIRQSQDEPITRPLALASNNEEDNKKLQLQLCSQLFCSDQEDVQTSIKHPESMKTDKGPEHQF